MAKIVAILIYNWHKINVSMQINIKIIMGKTNNQCCFSKAHNFTISYSFGILVQNVLVLILVLVKFKIISSFSLVLVRLFTYTKAITSLCYVLSMVCTHDPLNFVNVLKLNTCITANNYFGFSFNFT